MPSRYPLITAYCAVCERRTGHKADRKLQYHCTEHAPDGLSVKQRKQRQAREEEERQGDLF